MATMKVEGIASLEKMLKELSTLDQGKAAEDMLNVGKVEVEKAWTHQIELKGLKKSGLMKSQITSGKPKTNIYGMFTTIYPQGWEYDEKTHKKRVRNATKAFMLHYGFYNHRTEEVYKEAKGWIDDVEKEALNNAVPAMEKVFELYLKSKG